QQRTEEDRGHRDGSRHHEEQARVPITGDVQEVEHLARIRHAREPQADAEQKSRAERRDHEGTPSTWRMITAVAMPVARKIATATSERIEKRPRPQTPWPLVQPPLTRVPRPTSSPPAAAQPRPNASRTGAGP